MKKIILLLTFLSILSCKVEDLKEIEAPTLPVEIYEYGFKLNDYKVINDTIKRGENFSEILDRHHIEYPKVLEITQK